MIAVEEVPKYLIFLVLFSYNLIIGYQVCRGGDG
jgi:hypothetical protein